MIASWLMSMLIASADPRYSIVTPRVPVHEGLAWPRLRRRDQMRGGQVRMTTTWTTRTYSPDFLSGMSDAEVSDVEPL